MKVEGKGGISATIIADSIANNKRITTFELEYPRFIHSEFMTHRLFSRNAASSRAIPTNKLIDLVDKNPAMPIHWGKNQPGMKADEECSNEIVIHGQSYTREEMWGLAAEKSSWFAQEFNDFGYHKQIVNRILEPYQFIKVVCTATEFDNFFWLRCHKDAQPEIRELADCMYNAMQQNTAFIQELDHGEWHVPYVDYTKTLGYTIPVGDDYENGRIDLTLDEALRVSSSCCAQVSYRVLDNSIEKAEKIYHMLVTSEPIHASPFEHQATPIPTHEARIEWDTAYTHALGTPSKGITHYDRYGNAWSGNLCGWVQHRQLIPNNTFYNHKES